VSRGMHLHRTRLIRRPAGLSNTAQGLVEHSPAGLAEQPRLPGITQVEASYIDRIRTAVRLRPRCTLAKL
jgi:hypothetical protein